MYVLVFSRLHFPSSSKIIQSKNSVVLPKSSLLESEFQEDEKQFRVSPFSRLSSSATEILSSVEENLQSRSASNSTAVDNEGDVMLNDSIEREQTVNGSFTQTNTSNLLVHERKDKGKIFF